MIEIGGRPHAAGANAPFGKLDAQQAGSIRHIANLSRQLDGDWSLMGARAAFQEDFGAFRFQLAFSGYALALAHFHRLPNAPGVFKPIFERLIHKMMLPDVWSYWRDVSRGGARGNAHLRGSLPERWDPVAEDNIMFSAYLQVLTLMYNYMFDDDRYTRPGALTMGINPFHFGERMTFEYDQNSLNERIYWQMVESGYLGVACEPNCVFQICNQIPILGFRLHDILTGGNRAEEVTAGYLRAWEEFGMLDANGDYTVMVMPDTRTPVGNHNGYSWSNSWLAAMMNAWNPDYVAEQYKAQAANWLVPGPDGTIGVRLWDPIDVRGEMMTLDTADFGWAAACASEMGDQEVLEGLLKHADRYMEPTWRQGGLYYPRNDTRFDEDGILRQVEPITGNALLPYARLNIPQGLHDFYNKPWDRSHFEQPLITEVSDNVDVTEAWYDVERRQLLFGAKPWSATAAADARIGIDHIFDQGRGSWTLWRGNQMIAEGGDRDVLGGTTVRRDGDHLQIDLDASGSEDFILAWQ